MKNWSLVLFVLSYAVTGLADADGGRQRSVGIIFSGAGSVRVQVVLLGWWGVSSVVVWCWLFACGFFIQGSFVSRCSSQCNHHLWIYLSYVYSFCMFFYHSSWYCELTFLITWSFLCICLIYHYYFIFILLILFFATILYLFIYLFIIYLFYLFIYFFCVWGPGQGQQTEWWHYFSLLFFPVSSSEV